MLRHSGRDGISSDPGVLRTGTNSGHMAIGIAALAGATRIVLLGYDAKAAEDRRKHWFGDHPDKTGPMFGEMVRCMRTAAPALAELGIEVLNATPGSAVDCFPSVSLEAALAGL